MSELDRDGAKTLDDEDTDSIETIIEDNDEQVTVAEPTDRTAFQAELRSFCQLFNSLQCMGRVSFLKFYISDT